MSAWLTPSNPLSLSLSSSNRRASPFRLALPLFPAHLRFAPSPQKRRHKLQMSVSELFSGVLNYFLGSESSSGAAPRIADSPSPQIGNVAGERWLQNANKNKLEKLRGFHSVAKECISRGIEADDSGDASEAVKQYRASLAVISEGLSITFIGQSMPEVRKLQQEMIRWRSHVEEILERRKKQGSSTSSRPAQPSQMGRSVSGRWPVKEETSALSRPAPELKRQTSQQLSGRKTANRMPKDSSIRGGSEESIKGADKKIVAMIEEEIVDRSPGVKWDDIAGLENAKQALQEMVILPTLRSDLFQGLRKPARGLLLYGPPGNGKTMLAKAVASEAAATFFSLSASSLTSKWVGEGEKLMKALFAVAAARQPSVIFIDEIDSILSARSTNEHEASRRLKTEFLVQFDGVMANDNDRVIVMGATNRPQELDDAARRRLVKRIYIPLPDTKARKALLKHLLKGQAFHLQDRDLDRIVSLTEGYSGSDLKALCQEAAMEPIRELGARISTVRANQVRKLTVEDFEAALKVIRASVSKGQLRVFEDWNREFGSS